MRSVRRVAVLGAGTMGSRIAAHFANAGVPALLLDVVLPEAADRNAAALKGIEAAAKQKPGAFFTDSTPMLITPGNFEDHLGGIRECDWVIEAVTENLEIKRSLLEKAAAWRRPGTILSTNTSGIPLRKISEGFSPECRRNFLGTHFFNPPRYLYLVEVIPGPETDAQVLDFVSDFCDRRLGKGVVRAKDTPGFIANRIGSFFGATVCKLVVEGDYTIEEADALTGPLIGLPRSASFRLFDIIGLDVWAHIARNLYELAPHDPWRERFLLPGFFTSLIERGWLGEKTGQGFYRRTGKEIRALDWKTLEHRPMQAAVFPPAEAAQRIEDLAERLRFLVRSTDRAGTFLWKLLSDVLLYAAGRVPEISDRIVEIDRAMRWGYAHKLGPFELWDALGVEETALRIEREGRSLPERLSAMLASGAGSFYRPADRDGVPRSEYFDLARCGYQLLEERPGVLALADVKRARGVVKRNAGGSLIDLGDGVLCLEFDQKANVVGDDQIAMTRAAVAETARSYQALVVAGQGEHFSAGADLKAILSAAQAGRWDELDAAVRRLQQASMAVKYAPRPVVPAPFGMTLGAGCQVALHAAAIQASAETHMGLVEANAGLIPAGGGSKEMLLRLADPQRVMELIGWAKVSSSAQDARQMGLLRPADRISMNPERLLADAKALALSIAPGYSPGLPRDDIAVSGEAGYEELLLGLRAARESGRLTEYDAVVGEKLAWVLSGGRSRQPKVSEQYLLDLEREAFLSLCGNRETQERIERLLARRAKL